MLFSTLGRLYAATAALAHCPTACLTVCACVCTCVCEPSLCLYIRAFTVSVYARECLVCEPSVARPALCAWVCSAPHLSDCLSGEVVRACNRVVFRVRCDSGATQHLCAGEHVFL